MIDIFIKSSFVHNKSIDFHFAWYFIYVNDTDDETMERRIVYEVNVTLHFIYFTSYFIIFAIINIGDSQCLQLFHLWMLLFVLCVCVLAMCLRCLFDLVENVANILYEENNKGNSEIMKKKYTSFDTETQRERAQQEKNGFQFLLYFIALFPLFISLLLLWVIL